MATQPQLPSSMRAIAYSAVGGPGVLELVRLPLPSPAPGEVLVRVAAAGVNPVDFKIRRGDVPGLLMKLVSGFGRWPPTPSSNCRFVPGGDVAGVVASAPPGSRFPPGSRVFGLKMALSGAGTYAEIVAMPESALALVPEGTPLQAAAGVPLAALTAKQALDRLPRAPAPGLPRGSRSRLLVHAGAGGVGSFAVQLAKARGLAVTATCSGRNAALVRGLGAESVVDYTRDRFESAAGPAGFDAVLDTVGGDVELRSLAALKRGGHFLSVLNSGWQTKYGPAVGPAMGMLHWAGSLAR